MPTKSPGNASKPSSSKKRKSDDCDSERPAKQSKKIDSYFSQLYPVSSNSKESESQPVPLNDEQKRVLEMVVEEGKNVFFTGAAGTSSIHTHKRPSSLAFAVADLAFLFVDQEPESHYYFERSLLPSRKNTRRNRPSFLSPPVQEWQLRTLVVCESPLFGPQTLYVREFLRHL